MPKQITIQKGTMTKTVSEYSWNLMGKNKNGWVEVETGDQVVTNEVVHPTIQPKFIDAGPVVNEVQETSGQVVSNEVEAETLEAKNNSFVEQAKELNIKSGMLKDFCDINGIGYKAKDKPEVLLEKIGEFLNGDIEKFKTEFGI